MSNLKIKSMISLLFYTLFCITLFIASVAVTNMALSIFMTLISIVFFIFGIFYGTSAKLEKNSFKCPNCKKTYKLSVLKYLTSIKIGKVRNLKCPHCCIRSWVKEKYEEDNEKQD